MEGMKFPDIYKNQGLRQDIERYKSAQNSRRELDQEIKIRVRDLRKSVRSELSMLGLGAQEPLPLFRVEEMAGGTYLYEEYISDQAILRKNVRNRYVENTGSRKYVEKKAEKSQMGVKDGSISFDQYLRGWPFDEESNLLELAERIIVLNGYSKEKQSLRIEDAPLSRRSYD